MDLNDGERERYIWKAGMVKCRVSVGAHYRDATKLTEKKDPADRKLQSV